jgi:hypothetical protein
MAGACPALPVLRTPRLRIHPKQTTKLPSINLSIVIPLVIYIDTALIPSVLKAFKLKPKRNALLPPKPQCPRHWGFRVRLIPTSIVWAKMIKKIHVLIPLQRPRRPAQHNVCLLGLQHCRQLLQPRGACTSRCRCVFGSRRQSRMYQGGHDGHGRGKARGAGSD